MKYFNDNINSLIAGESYSRIDKYQFIQPIDNCAEKIKINNLIENIPFVPKSNVRIWFNTQTDYYPPHKHSAIEIAIPVHNKYSYTVCGKSYELKVGDIFFVPINALHQLKPNQTGSRFIYLFNLDFMQKYFDYNDFMNFFSSPQLINFSTHPETYNQIYKEFMEINDLYFSYNSKVLEIKIFSHLLSIFGTLLHGNTNVIQPININNINLSEADLKFKNLINYIDSNYMKSNLSLDNVATFVGFSKYYFSRLFKEYTNQTFYEYLTNKRLSMATELLNCTTFSITDIAFRTGFSNLSSFCRAFNKKYNCSPSSYRSSLFIEM